MVVAAVQCGAVPCGAVRERTEDRELLLLLAAGCWLLLLLYLETITIDLGEDSTRRGNHRRPCRLGLGIFCRRLGSVLLRTGHTLLQGHRHRQGHRGRGRGRQDGSPYQ
jgi:hypothetical protein